MMKKTLFLASLLISVLTACNKEPPSPAGKKPDAPATQDQGKAFPIDPKAAAPIATDERTPPVDPKTGAPMTAGKK